MDGWLQEDMIYEGQNQVILAGRLGVLLIALLIESVIDG